MITDVGTVNEVSIEFAEELIETFGHPVKVYREYKPAKEGWEFTIFTRLVGKNVRFDVEIGHDELLSWCGLSLLLAQLPEQMMDAIERNMEFGHPWFSLDRKSTAGIVGKDPDNKVRSWIMLGQEYHILRETDPEGPYEHTRLY